MIVNLLNEGQSSGLVGREYSNNANMICKWRREFNDKTRSSFTGNGKVRMSEHEKEVAALKKQLREISIERDIIKKAAIIFS